MSLPTLPTFELSAIVPNGLRYCRPDVLCDDGETCGCRGRNQEASRKPEVGNCQDILEGMITPVPRVSAAAVERWESFADMAKTASCRERRRRMCAHIVDTQVPSVNALIQTVRGNTGDAAWLAQMMRDGELVLSGGRLALPRAPSGETLNALSARLHAIIVQLTNHPDPDGRHLANLLEKALDAWGE